MEVRKETQAPRTVASVRIPRAGSLALGAGFAAFCVLLYLGRNLIFFYDEWTLITQSPRWTLVSFFQPHNEHWSTLLKVTYEALLHTVGLRSYLPYLALALLLHVASALLLFVLVRRRAGDVLALVACALVLFLGAGAEDLFWAFQIGFNGSVAFGLAALLLLDRAGVSWRALIGASAALLASLMFSGVGLLFIIALAVELGLDRGRRRNLLALIIPVAVYLAWFAAFGRSVPGFPSPGAWLAYVANGIVSATAGLFALAAPLGVVVVAAVIGLVAFSSWRRATVDARLLGATAGLLAQFVLTGIVRSQLGAGQAASSRYLYVAAFFLVLIAIYGVRDLSWQPAAGVGVALAVAVVLTLDLAQLRGYAAEKTAFIDVEKADLQVATFYRGAPGLDLDAPVDILVMPQVTPRGYFAAIDRYGSPVASVDQHGVDRLPSAVVANVKRSILPG
jgi:hypothetical protein